MKHYLGIDIGSSFTKFTVIDEDNVVCYQNVVKTLTRDKEARNNILKEIHDNYNVSCSCATGYGREHFKDADITKTEIYCASTGVTAGMPVEKNIIDIGGEDIKVIRSDVAGKVLDFYMNSKCAAGTGTFITEIAERAELDLSEMSAMAQKSTYNKELNSFCTVFAKTEIMKWIFDEVPVEDVARGIYISIVNRIAKIRMDQTLPICLVGGVMEYHPFLKKLIAERFGQETVIPEKPQMTNSFGAALLAHKHADKVTDVKMKM